MVVEIGEEIRRARVAGGLSQGAVGRAAGVSHATISRLERGVTLNATVLRLARVCAIVGLDLSARAYPAGSPLRDRAHAAVGDRFQLLLHDSIRVHSEVPFPNPGDARAWDRLLRVGSLRTGVEIETRPRDGQDLERRMSLKRRDGGVDSMILVLPYTRSNRTFVRERDTSLRTLFPGDAKKALADLGSGVLPDEDVLLFV